MRWSRGTRSRVPHHPNVAPISFATVALLNECCRTSLTRCNRWLPCVDHGHSGTGLVWRTNPFSLVHVSAVSILLAPSLQLASLSMYSNHARAWRDASSRWIVALPASSRACELAPLMRPDNTAELSSNHKRDLPCSMCPKVTRPRIMAACSTSAIQCSELPQTAMSSGGSLRQRRLCGSQPGQRLKPQ